MLDRLTVAQEASVNPLFADVPACCVADAKCNLDVIRKESTVWVVPVEGLYLGA